MRLRIVLRSVLVGLVLIVSSQFCFADEQLDLTNPETFPTPASITYWKIDGLSLLRSEAIVIIHLIGTNGEKRTFNFRGPDATTYINALNKRNATTISNEKWTLNQLVSRGYLSGTISGTAD